jgi:regulator of extracellular matrix RemA (YlzA/DUF370 family)
MKSEFIDIGYGSVLNCERIIAVVTAETAPARRLISASKEKNLLVDASCGKRTKSVYVMDSGHIILSAREQKIGGTK